MLLAVSKTECALIVRALAVAAGSETNAKMVELGMALDARAALGRDAQKALVGAGHALRSYQYGNASNELAEGIAGACEDAIAAIVKVACEDAASN